MAFWDKIKEFIFKDKQSPHESDCELVSDSNGGLYIDDILKLTDQNAFVVAMGNWLSQKCDYGDRLDRLSPQEQVFYICNNLEEEVNNGGFSQYLYNSSGDQAHRVVECLKTIGATRTADICRTAFDAFGYPIPHNREEREAFLDRYETEQVSNILSLCDDRFYDYPDDLETLNYRYIMENRSYFT